MKDIEETHVQERYSEEKEITVFMKRPGIPCDHECRDRDGYGEKLYCGME